MLHVTPFTFAASSPRRSIRSTQHSLDVLQCLGKRYTLSEPSVATTITPDASSLITDDAAGSSISSINVVLAHANGFVKELYEPFIEHLLQKCRNIQAVYMHDVATQGASGLVNATKLGDEYHWSDSGLDLIAMVLHLRAAGLMDRQPVMGIGHSMGGCQVAYAALIHHSLFAAVVLMDPIIVDATNNVGALAVAAMSANRRDTWPSRAEAREKFLKNAFFRSWHEAVFERWMDYALTSNGRGEEVTLTTTVAQEVYSFLHHRSLIGKESSDPDTCIYVFQHLPFLTKSVHLLFGADSQTLSMELRGSIQSRLQHGSRVDVEGCGHLLPMEDPDSCASYCAQYAVEALRCCQQAENDAARHPRQLTISKEYKAELKTAMKEFTNKAKI